jgi:hypothetical protein
MGLLARFKPAASVGAHLLIAAVIWSGVGCMLLLRAWKMLSGYSLLWLALALAVGTGKSFFVLDRAARKNISRILALNDGTCLGGVYSWKMWGVVALMIIAGMLLRASSLPLLLIGCLYAAIGWALLFSSRLVWLQWFGKETKAQ